MPIPKPKKGESRQDFVSRCMGDAAMQEYPADPDNNQRLAVCESAWRKAKGEKKAGAAVMTHVLDTHVYRATALELRAATADGAEPLPAGVCGRLTGIALVYDTPDDYDTVFARGCLAKTVVEKVNAGKVLLLADHGPFTGTHVGTVRAIKDVGDAAVLSADLFDTEAGRDMKEYLEAVIASGAMTGLSVGFRPRDQEWREVKSADGDTDVYCVYKEIELREISVTPVPAVPGAEVTAVRREPGESDDTLLKRALAHILHALPEREARAVYETVYASSAARPDTSDAPPQAAGEAAGASTTDAAAGAEGATGTHDGPPLATEAERILAFRSSFA